MLPDGGRWTWHRATVSWWWRSLGKRGRTRRANSGEMFAAALQRGGPLTIKHADMHMRRLQCVGSLQSAATMLYIAEIISRSDWTVINGISPRCFNAVTPRAADNFSRVPGHRYTICDFAGERRSCSFAAKGATPYEEAYIVRSHDFFPPRRSRVSVCPRCSLGRTINSGHPARGLGDNVFIYCLPTGGDRYNKLIREIQRDSIGDGEGARDRGD